PPATHERDQQAILAALARLRVGPPPPVSDADKHVAVLFNHWCLGCHTMDGIGGREGPDLSHEGTKSDQTSLERRITDPTTVKPDAEMPAFGMKMSPDDVRVLAAWLAAKK